MKEFLKPTKFNIIFTVFFAVIVVLSSKGIIGGANIGHWLWSLIEFITMPYVWFSRLGVWFLAMVNPGIKDSAEPIVSQLGVIQYLIVWPLSIIYFYVLGSIIQKIEIRIFNKQ